MKKSLLTIVLCAFAFGLGFGLNNVALSNVAASKIAYVNVGKLLTSSNTIKTAQSTKDKQAQELQKLIATANADVQKAAQKDKAAVAKKYEAQIKTKRESIQSAYTKKLMEVDKQLETAIATKAKALGYDIVLRSDSVLYGSSDITAQIVPLVK